MEKFPAIILAGGFGTRLSSISKGTPKALMPVGNGVFLDFLLERLFKSNVSYVYFSTYYKSNLFDSYIAQSKFKKKITNIVEPKPLGTGGAIKFVIKKLNIESPFIVLNGDSISDTNINEMINYFLKKNFGALMSVSKQKNLNRFGTVISKGDKIVLFDEKSSKKNGWINNGHYILSKRVLKFSNKIFSLEKDLFPKLVEKNEIGCFKVYNDNFIDIGIPSDYKKLCKKFGVNK